MQLIDEMVKGASGVEQTLTSVEGQVGIERCEFTDVEAVRASFVLHLSTNDSMMLERGVIEGWDKVLDGGQVGTCSLQLGERAVEGTFHRVFLADLVATNYAASSAGAL
jgi:hypothetical protein